MSAPALKYDAFRGTIECEDRQVAALSVTDRASFGPMFAAAPAMLEALHHAHARDNCDCYEDFACKLARVIQAAEAGQ